MKIGPKRDIMRSLGVVAAALAIALSTTTSASAHYVYENEEVWANADSSKCLYNYAEVSHGSRGGYTKSQAHTGQNTGPGGCIFPWVRPAGELAAGYRYQKWDGAKWYTCRMLLSGDGVFSKTSTGIYTVSWDFGVAPPCGGGYYGTIGYSGTFYGGEWLARDVPVWSGQHYIEP
ncbi:hypothetical protein [Streptomyces sp. CA-146814]|uniref:hypothetical protein n=1 Tax=Streptomyces sp. CA-146814 TaxID=3240053 RepID=UPI003D8B5E72